MKKLFAFLVIIAVCFCFAACEQEQAGTPTPPAVSRTDAPAEPQISVKKVTLSGDANDTFVAEEHCYAEGKNVYLYFEKGVTVRGDMIELTERVMDDLCDYTGLDFARNCEYNKPSKFLDEHVPMSHFGEVNTDGRKIDVLLVHNPEKYAVQQAFAGGCILDMYDYDFEETGWQQMYHELSHVIHLRNGACLGHTMDEGFAVYTSYMTMREQKLPVWSTIQFFDPVAFDDSVIAEGESGFKCVFDPNDFSYHYGFRLVMFLGETYGEDVFFKIADEAENRSYLSSMNTGVYNSPERLDKSTDELIDIIKSQTDDDVFDQFASWNKKKFGKSYQDYKDYMNSIGQRIDW